VWRVSSPDPWTLGRFAVGVRERLLALLRPGDGLSGGVLRVSGPSAQRIEAASAVVRALAAPLDPLAAALALRADPVPGTRELADRLLVRRFPEVSSLGPVLAGSPCPAVRLEVALALRDDAVLVGLLSEPDPIGVHAALALAGRARGGPVEEALLARLGSGDPRLVDALGQAGTLRAVPALRALDTFWSPARSRARAAIAAIHARAAVPAGALSLCDDGPGAVSAADEPARGG
jgi:hypothetical protein